MNSEAWGKGGAAERHDVATRPSPSLFPSPSIICPSITCPSPAAPVALRRDPTKDLVTAGFEWALWLAAVPEAHAALWVQVSIGGWTTRCEVCPVLLPRRKNL